MKMITAIVNKDDTSAVVGHLTKAGFYVTKLATTGGFLLAGNTTLLMGVDDDKVEEVIGIIEEHSKKRTQLVPPVGTSADGAMMSIPIEVTVGGATIFVVDVDRFEKV